MFRLLPVDSYFCDVLPFLFFPFMQNANSRGRILSFFLQIILLLLQTEMFALTSAGFIKIHKGVCISRDVLQMLISQKKKQKQCVRILSAYEGCGHHLA